MENIISQNQRQFSFESPLGTDKLLVNKFEGTEAMHELFKFELELVSTDFTIQTEQMLGQNVTVGIRHINGTDFRYFNGQISKFAPIAHPGRLAYYKAEMVPWVWFLTLTNGCHIYQDETLPQVIQDVFQKYGYQDYSMNVGDRHKPWENCCQYQESAWAFVSRLMEIEGMYYFFKHEQGKHTLMIVDKMAAHTPCPYQSTYQFEHQIGEGALRDEDTILTADLHKVVKPNQYAHKDYNFKRPKDPLEITKQVSRDTGVSLPLEVYDYPGRYELPSDVTDWGDLRMEEQEHDHTVARGTSTGRAMMPGYKFDLAGADRGEENQNYLIVSVTHKGQEGSFVAGADAQNAEYTNKFTAHPSSVIFRAGLKTDEPRIYGTQTGFVVGPPGEEIYTDAYGRVRVKFHWDRRSGDENGNSSCWIRVMQPWAGPMYGHIWIPRVGMEVIITFIDGDPDRPLITGCVYHQNNMPPYPLPANKEWNGIKTRSTKGGTADNYNEIRLEDSIGAELFRIQAERDLHIFVKNDRSEYILNDRFLEVDADKHEKIKGDKYTDVEGDFNEHIKGDMKVQVEGDADFKIGGDQTEEVSGDKNQTVDGDFAADIQGDTSLHMEGDLDEEIDGDFKKQVQGDMSLEVQGEFKLKIDGKVQVGSDDEIDLQSVKKIVLQATEGITLMVGGSFIDITAKSITIQSAMVKLNPGVPPPTPLQPVKPDDADPDDPDTPDDVNNPDDKRFTSPAGDFPLPDTSDPEDANDDSTGDVPDGGDTGDGGSSGGSSDDSDSSGGDSSSDDSSSDGSDSGGGLSDNPWVAPGSGGSGVA